MDDNVIEEAASVAQDRSQFYELSDRINSIEWWVAGIAAVLLLVIVLRDEPHA